MSVITKVSELVAAADVATDDLFYIVEDPAGIKQSKQVTGAQLATMVIGVHLVDGSGLIPTGGTTSQILSKSSNSDYEAEWVDLPEALPSGGTAGQVLTKNSATDFDAVWADTSSTVEVLTQAEYNALSPPDPNTIYLISDSLPSDFTEVTTNANATYTLAATDAGKYIRTTSAAAVTITVPLDATVPWEDFTEIFIEQAGAGQVTIDGEVGVTLHSTESLKTAAQYAVLSLKRVGVDEWVVGGEREIA